MNNTPPMTTRRVYLFRHGETVWNTEGRYQGMKDSPLTALGRQQAMRHAALMEKFDIKHIYASPLSRVRETLSYIQQTVPISVKFENCLVELGAGEWEGRKYDEVKKLYAEHLKQRKDNLAQFKPPRGESRSELLARLQIIRRRILEGEANSDHSYAILSHGAVTRVLIMSLLGISIATDPPFSTGNDVVYRIEITGADVSVSHFVDGEGPMDGLYFPGLAN
ncbi:MAG: histidine phosphatase family protein [Gammaproteobacteria bacterium]|nr:histidine phosphatase family protein [Gammaproteobacteria bacterium]MYF02012.1 histidine phosphatase family protein [Gammaproteobacteria bacterium]MYI77546.1 histidine phosphatase family protein [Gammaproteobacteria bacterium]